MRESPFTRLAGARRAVAMVLVVALLALATAAHARAPVASPGTAPAAPEDVGKLLTYAGCAVSIAIAASSAQIYVAVFGCVRIFIEEVDW